MEGLRLDKWLWFARLAKSRSLAQKLIEEGEISLNTHIVAKPSHPVRLGDEILLPRGRAFLLVRVDSLAERRGPATRAGQLYTELRPGPG